MDNNSSNNNNNNNNNNNINKTFAGKYIPCFQIDYFQQQWFEHN